MTGDRQADGGVSHAPAGDCGRPGRRRWLRVAAIAAALAGVACLAAGCSSPAAPAANPSSSASAAGNSPSNRGAQALAYSKCMRSHGISDFPDPTVHGNGVNMGVSSKGDLNPSNPANKAAAAACRSLSPAGNPPAQSAQDLAADVKFAACMRLHGFPGFPDPDGQGVFNLPRTIDTSSAQFGSATSTCRTQANLHGLNISQGGPGSGS